MDKSYLEYPKRGYGQDHDFYDWRMAKDRPKIKWDGEAKVAICFIVPLEFFPLNPSGVPFKHPGAMVTPYPDLRHFTVRDYGNRVGVFRILEAIQGSGIKATFAVNGEVAKRYPPLLRIIKSAGHEITAYGMSTNHIHYEGLSVVDEVKLIEETLACFETKPNGWMSPARNQSSRTLDLLADNNIDYCLDWEIDSVPVQTNKGLSLIPNSYELSDFTVLHTRKQTEKSWLTQVVESIQYLISEHGRFGGQMLSITLTPYIMGQPFRICYLDQLMDILMSMYSDDVSIVSVGEIDRQFRAQQ